MAIQVEHGPSAMAYGPALAQAARYGQLAQNMLPFMQQYYSQSHQAGESEKQRAWQSQESLQDRGQQDKQLALQAMLAEYNAQNQQAMQRLQSGKPLNPQPMGYTRGGPNSQYGYTPQYGFPGQGVNYQDIFSQYDRLIPGGTSGGAFSGYGYRR